MNRTDLAHEIASNSGICSENSTIGTIRTVRVAVESRGIGKPVGDYYTLFCPEREIEDEINALFLTISPLLPDKRKRKSLVVGLGNENITPDSLGSRAAGKVLATAHFADSMREEFDELGLQEVYVITPGVMAQTGLDSADYLKLISDSVQPDCMIVIDSLACSERERLGRTIQVTDTGISPGSGVKNERKEFSRDVFGFPVIAVGVPTVIDVGEDMLVPRDIDVIVNHFARVISAGVNRALNPALDESEIEQLLM
jgi:spore protease